MHPYFDLIPRYFPNLSNKQLDRFAQLWDIYHYWNSKINVISRKDIGELYLRHVLHSLSIAKKFQLNPGTTILDVGTGGGFPGIPLSIYFESSNFTLVDSVGKKIKVVNETINTLGLRNALGLQMRAEKINGQFDLVISRAVAKLPMFLSWVADKIQIGNTSGVGNGIIYLKGGDLEEELDLIPWDNKIYDISSFFSEDFFTTKKIVHLKK